MGVSSNSEVFLSDKDLNGNMDPEFGLLIRPVTEIHDEECQTSILEDHEPRPKQESVQERDQEEDKDHQEEQQQSNIIVPVPVAPLNLKLEIPSYKVVEILEKDGSNDGFKTPTSSDHKIPAILKCPPAPRRPKSRPSPKRKACRSRILLNLSKELEALFPTPLVVDLGAGGKNKKVKQCSGDENHTDSKIWRWGKP